MKWNIIYIKKRIKRVHVCISDLCHTYCLVATLSLMLVASRTSPSCLMSPPNSSLLFLRILPFLHLLYFSPFVSSSYLPSSLSPPFLPFSSSVPFFHRITLPPLLLFPSPTFSSSFFLLSSPSFTELPFLRFSSSLPSLSLLSSVPSFVRPLLSPYYSLLSSYVAHDRV